MVGFILPEVTGVDPSLIVMRRSPLKRVLSFLFVASFLFGTALAQDGLEEAQGLLAEQKYQEAMDKFDQVLENHPDSAAARIGMARSCYMLGENELGNFHALKAEKADANNVEAVELTGLTFRAIGDAKMAAQSDPSGSFEEAIVSFKKASGLNSTNDSYRGQLGYLHFMLSQFKESAAAYDEACALAKDDANHPYQAARSHLFAQQYDKGIAAIQRSLALAPDYAGSFLLQGNLYMGKEEKGKAADNYGIALIKGGLSGAEVSEAALRLRQCFIDESNWPPLIEKYKAWVAADPSNAIAHWWLGYTEYLKKDYAAAIKTFQKARKAWGKEWAETSFRIGQCLEGQSKFDEASQEYVKAHWLSNGDANHSWTNDQETPVFRLRTMYGSLFGQQKFEEAVEIAEKHTLPIVSEGQRFMILQDIGFFCRDWGVAVDTARPVEARKLYKKSTKFYEDAVKAFDVAEGATDSQLAQIQNDTGLMYHYHFNDMKKAVMHYRKALTFDATYADAILNYGRILNKLGKYQEAKDLLETGPKDRADIQQALREASRKLKASGL